MLPPKIGDTVILRAVVKEIDNESSFDLMRLNFIDCASPGDDVLLSVNRVHAVIPAPLPTPKVGDTVYRNGSDLPHTLVCIHQEVGDDRKWGVVSYRGDIPTSCYFKDLRTKL